MGCLHDNCSKTPLHAEGCLWGTNYSPICTSSPHPHPTPLTHCLISVGILFWLNGLKHKLAPHPTPPLPKLFLVHENNPGKRFVCEHEALFSARDRKPRWKTEVCHCPRITHCVDKTTFASTPTSSQGKQETGCRLLASLQNKNKTAFQFFQPIECMAVKINHLFANVTQTTMVRKL